MLPLPGRFEELASRASEGLLEDLRYQRRRLAREGKLELVRATRETWAEMLQDLFRLHRARWEARGGPGVVVGGALERFHADATRELLDAGMLRMVALRLDGRTLGVLHGFHDRGRAYAYLQGIDPAAARRSPGTLLFGRAIEEAIAEGALELDFLRGREAYKYRWGAEDRPILRLARRRVRTTPRRRADRS